MHAGWRVRVCGVEEISARDIAAWEDLERRAAEPNAFLSPHFAVPALRHLEAKGAVQVVLVERTPGGCPELAGVGLFRRALASKRFPVPHLAAHRTRHSFLGGMLVDANHIDATLDAMLEHVNRWVPAVGGLKFPGAWADGALASSLTRHAGKTWIFADDLESQRPVLKLSDATSICSGADFRRRTKGWSRRWKRLQEAGTVSTRVYRAGTIPEEVIETFLDLEHRGWKGAEGSSLRANQADESFFRETVANFARHERALFTQLLLDGTPIASTSNFIAGSWAFAFKIGWDPRYRQFSPGTLCELELMRCAESALPDVHVFDSCTDVRSYVAELWPDRRTVGTLAVSTTPVAQAAVESAAKMRTVKRLYSENIGIQVAATHAARPDWFGAATESVATIATLL